VGIDFNNDEWIFFIERIIILATDEHGEARINTEEFNKLKIKQKSKCQSVRIRNNPCKSVAKRIKMRIAAK